MEVRHFERGQSTKTMVEALRRHALVNPAGIAFRFLHDGEAEVENLTLHSESGSGMDCHREARSAPRKGKVHRKMEPIAMRVTEMGASEGCPVIGQIEVASPQGDNITSPETELTSTASYSPGTEYHRNGHHCILPVLL